MRKLSSKNAILLASVYVIGARMNEHKKIVRNLTNPEYNFPQKFVVAFRIWASSVGDVQAWFTFAVESFQRIRTPRPGMPSLGAQIDVAVAAAVVVVRRLAVSRCYLQILQVVALLKRIT